MVSRASLQQFEPRIPEVGDPRDAREHLRDKADKVHGLRRSRRQDEVDAMSLYQTDGWDGSEERPVLVLVRQQNQERRHVALQALRKALATVGANGRSDQSARSTLLVRPQALHLAL